ncbi:protein SCO1 homolog 2, mitochondrial isoform X2 [Magnolia sinica]|uniref:protein SCO1 homolog 2, mitochondrial isoform X2 n=1 Tax=Magnolia sinica TaxID=86752 RepID=UPI002658B236|nr:protein SCO1 homolog 2, mitochondrial isoform X2 [Magnolia sinica]
MLASHFQKHSRLSLNLLLLQRSGPFRRFQFRGYAASPNSEDKRLHTIDKSLHSQPWSWSTYAVPAGLLVIAGAGMFVHYNDERRAIPKGSHQGTGNNQNTIKGPAIGGPFRLIDMNNNVVTDRDLRGNWVLMYFGYTSSPDVGPKEIQKMAKAIDILESQQNLKIKPVFISIDPLRDSPSHLRAYLKEFDRRIVGLTGSIDAIRQIAQEFRVYFKKVEEDGEDYLIQSSHNMYLMDPNMEIVRCFGVEYDAEQLAEAILKEVKKASSSDKQV